MLHGGRYGMKSHTIARYLLLMGMQDKCYILCTREVQNSIKESVHRLLKDVIEQYNLSFYKITNDAIIGANGTEFTFRGLSNITQNQLKSFENVKYCWIEEAQTITHESIEILTPTIRAPGNKIIATFNRWAENDPIFEKFCREKRGDVLVIYSTYKDVPDDWISDEIKAEAEYDRVNNPDLYSWKWLGEPLNQSDTAIIKRNEIIEAMAREIEAIGQIQIGADIARYGEDRTVFFKRHGMKVIDYKIYKHKSVTEVAALLADFANDKSIEIKVDDTGLGGGVTDILTDGGYNVIPVNFGGKPLDNNKYDMIISEMWFQFAESISQVCLPDDADLLSELSSRQYSIDNRGVRKVEAKANYKKRAGKSPDLADALLLCFYRPPVNEVKARTA
jgi:phage terminase large subunit